MTLEPARKATPVELSAAVLGALVFLAGLALFAYAGSYARYWSDDYCYGYFVRENSLLPGLWSWYIHLGNRFSTLVPVAVSELFGPRSVSFVPAFILALWLGAWVFFLARLCGALGWQGSRRWLVLLGCVLVYFNVLLAPDRLQSVYWRMGAFHYSLPLALLLLNLGWLAARRQRGPAAGVALGSGLLAFFAGGLSETFAAFQAGLLGLVLAGAWVSFSVIGRAGPAHDRKVETLPPPGGREAMARALGPAGGAFTGALLALAALALAPSNAMRQAVMPPPDNLFDVLTYSLRYALDFTTLSLRAQPLPNLVFAGLAALIAFLAGGELAGRVPLRTALAGAAVALGSGFVLVVCCMAPSAYGALLYPPDRALMTARFAFLLGLGGAAVFAGLAARRAVPQPRWSALRTLAALLLLAGCIYPLRALPAQRAEISVLSLKAARWDGRDAQIRAQAGAGVRAVQVQETDVVQGLEDLGPDPAGWVNGCAARYYQVDSITANPQ